ncbi:HupE/UreJ family protein [Croceimicrobium hydrocarbonivorans]|uniref:HupE/UreJ family protein n=1 Tax=Croceimicrobium hydrocarbonivorans TaxID=2761580 RepID=A0A7H0VGZ6_9FLAO|nr:HupE/UreJ family protein [Croceimicrobium hydrocarbonivorans]QNR24994.1 HupE/UreJ family protein [Croceimicrobium hydrocarbonivorans]
MQTFSTYLRLGYEHIMSIQAMDHILFVVVLMAVYQSRNWLRVVAAVTFFTIGHSLTLSLGALDVIKIDKGIIEFLIPLTILLTALYNLTKSGQNQNNKSKVWIAGVFGLIHGLGFSNYYDMLVMGDSNYWQALLPFNLGIELAQLLLVAITLLLMGVYSFMLNRKIRDWNLFVSGAGFGLALIMCLENWPF